MLAQQ
jgi:hypothetical protein